MQLAARQRLKTFASKHYRYAMVNRPAGPGACPKDFLGTEDHPPHSSIHYEMARNGVCVYSRKLTDAETKNFEMALMVDNSDTAALQEYVAVVLESFGEYASRYAQKYGNDAKRFSDEVYRKLKSNVKGYVPSLDTENLASLVLQAIKS